MKEVSVFDAKTHLSGLIDRVCQQNESITITRRGRRVAKLVPFEETPELNVAQFLRELNALSGEIGKVGLGLKEIKKMKEEGRR